MTGHRKFSRRSLLAMGAALVFAVCMLIARTPLVQFIYLDSANFPYRFAPEEVRSTISPWLQTDEKVLAVNIDAFDLEHINILTSKRVLRFDSSHSRTPDVDVGLASILDLSLKRGDSRYVLLTTEQGEVVQMFFVGGGAASFINKVNRRISKET